MRYLMLCALILYAPMHAESHNSDRVPEAQVYTLYRNSAADRSMRLHVATFDATHGESYNRENCIIARNLFEGQPGVTVDYWCDNGYATE